MARQEHMRGIVKLGLAAGLAGVLPSSALALSSPNSRPEGQPAGSSTEAREPGLAAALEAVPIAQLPLEVHRRAARYFEGIRQTSDSNWFDAHLGAYATALSRPGLSGVAYWEVPVLGPAAEPLGYMILSTGEHDFPVVGAARGGEPPSVQLRRLAALRGQQIARIWAPAQFVFVAENAAGDEIARVGSLPSKIDGIDEAVLDLPDSARHGSSLVEPGRSPEYVTPAALEGLRLSGFGSWRDYKAAHASPGLGDAIARRNAAAFWRSEREVQRTAHEVTTDAAERIQILARGDASYQLTGAARELLKLERITDASGAAWLRVRALSAPKTGVATATLSFSYASGEREQLGLVIAPKPLALPLPVLGAGLPSSCKRVALRTDERGNYVRAPDRKGPVDARADKVGIWETFELEQPSAGKIALRAGFANRYVSAVNGGGGDVSLIGTRASVWETFTLVPQPGDTFALRASNGMYVSAQSGGGGELTANRPVASTWERFQIACNPPTPAVYFADYKDEAAAWALQRKYMQLDGNKGLNRSPCASGCGATAWAMLLGYIDHTGANGVARNRPFNRIYLSGGGRGRSAADAVAPEFNDTGIQRVTLEIRDLMNDWGASGCSITGERFTMPAIMAQSTQYFWGRVPARVESNYDGAFVTTGSGVSKVVRALRTRRQPIAVGMSMHYPVAFGLRSVTPRRWDPKGNRWLSAGSAEWMLDANWGWGERFSRSVPMSAWLQGTIETTPYSRVDAVARDCRLRGQSGGATGRVDRDYNCRTHLRSDERHVGMEVAVKLLDRDVMPGLRSKGQKACLLKTTDIQCAPCNTTDRLIVRMDIRGKTAGCPSETVNELR